MFKGLLVFLGLPVILLFIANKVQQNAKSCKQKLVFFTNNGKNNFSLLYKGTISFPITLRLSSSV